VNRNMLLKATTEIDTEEYYSTERPKSVIIDYYILEEEEEKNYGLKVIKKEYSGTGKTIHEEAYTANEVSDSEEKANKIIELLARNKVTPIAVENVLEDIAIM